MNQQIVRVFGLVTLLFAVLVGFTSWRSVVQADELQEEPSNRRLLLESQRVQKGDITARDGTVLARDRGEGEGARRLYSRTYPEDGLFAHPVGYSYAEQGSTGVEGEYLDELTGRANEFQTLLDQLRGRPDRGNDLRTSLDPRAQRIATDALRGRAGSVVAIEPRTGRVRAMVSVPSFDPNSVPGRLAQLNQADGEPLVNRATQSQYPPGSTFKVLTAAAALDSGEFTPSSTVDGDTGLEVAGIPLRNFGNQSFGTVDLTTAMSRSVNTAWAQVALDLGARRMEQMMDRFGLYDTPPVDLPANQLATSAVFRQGGGQLRPTDGADIGRVAIGQGGLLVTPLQMAIITATIANDGVMMAPRIGQSVTDPDGREVRGIGPDRVRRVLDADDARALKAMMRAVVEEGTGTAAQIPGATVAGKTGTAEIDPDRNINQAWFVGFTPLERPRIAVVATVERTTATGGEDALPIARALLEALG